MSWRQCNSRVFPHGVNIISFIKIMILGVLTYNFLFQAIYSCGYSHGI